MAVGMCAVSVFVSKGGEEDVYVRVSNSAGIERACGRPDPMVFWALIIASGHRETLVALAGASDRGDWLEAAARSCVYRAHILPILLFYSVYRT